MNPTRRPDHTHSHHSGRESANALPDSEKHTAKRVEKRPKATRNSRGQIKAACHECRRRRTRCDGKRPMCSSCQQRGATGECDYDTGDVAESRTAALKRENGTLKETLSLLGQAFEHIRNMAEGDALSLLGRARSTADPIAASVSLGRVPYSDLAPATSSPLVAETRMELELQAMYGAVYPREDPVDQGNIDATLARSHLWRASGDWRASRKLVTPSPTRSDNVPTDFAAKRSR